MKEHGLKNRYETLKNVLSNRENQEDTFLKDIVRKLNSAHKADFTFVGKLNDNKTIDTLVVFNAGNYLDNFTYDLINTPCETVVNERIGVFSSNIQSLYPKASLLKDLGIEAYAGIALMDINNKVTGVLASMFTHSFEDKELSEMLLQIFAPQASIEIEHL